MDDIDTRYSLHNTYTNLKSGLILILKCKKIIYLNLNFHQKPAVLDLDTMYILWFLTIRGQLILTPILIKITPTQILIYYHDIIIIFFFKQ